MPITHTNPQWGLYNVKKKLLRKQIQGQIILDIPKAYDRIDRKNIACVLYELEVPGNTVLIIIIRHSNTKLCAKHDGRIGHLPPHNVGVAQGSPISDQIFIIYDDTVMGNYDIKLKTDTRQVNIIKRNHIGGNNWASHRIDQYNINQSMGNSNTKYTPNSRTVKL